MIIQPFEQKHQLHLLNRETGSFTKENSKENFLKRNLNEEEIFVGF